MFSRFELETYGTDFQHVHGTTFRNIEMASNKNGYGISTNEKPYGTDLQHVHCTTCRNIEMASHCLPVIHPITTRSYGYGKIRLKLQYGYEITISFPSHTKTALNDSPMTVERLDKMESPFTAMARHGSDNQ